MSVCSFSHPYAIHVLAEHLHNVPRVDASFKDVKETFAPDSGQYLESLGFWAVVLAVLGGILFLALVLCVLCRFRFCRFESAREEGVEKADVKRSKVAVGVVLLLAALNVCALLYGCVQSNLVIKDATDNLQEADQTLSFTNQQILDSKTVLSEEVNSHLGHLVQLVHDKGNVSQEQSVNNAVAIVDNVDAELDDLKITLETAKLASAVETGNSLKNIWLFCSVAVVLWFAVLVVLGFMSLVCAPACLLKLTMVCASITIVIAFAASGTSFALSLGMSDFCVNPDENTITYLSDSNEAGSLRIVRRSVSNPSSSQDFSSITSLPYVLSPSPIAMAMPETSHALRPSISVSASHVLRTAFGGVSVDNCTTVYLSSSFQPTVITKSNHSNMMANSSFVNFKVASTAVPLPSLFTAGGMNYTLQDASRLVTSVSNTQRSDPSVLMGKTSIVTRQHRSSDKAYVVYCPHSTALPLVTLMMSPTPLPTSTYNVSVPVTTTPTYAPHVTVTVEPGTTSAPVVSDSPVSYYVYCSDACGDPFAKDFLAAKDELYHLRSSLDRLQIDLMSTSGSETLIASALDGVLSVNASVLILEEKVRCSDLHELYAAARDSACDKGIISLFTMACSCFILGVLCLPLFVCLRWTDVTRRNYDKAYETGSCPTSDLDFINEASSVSVRRLEPNDGSSDPPRYSSLSGTECVQCPESHLSGYRSPSVGDVVVLNYGAGVQSSGQAIERYELSAMRFELGLDGFH